MNNLELLTISIFPLTNLPSATLLNRLPQITRVQLNVSPRFGRGKVDFAQHVTMFSDRKEAGSDREIKACRHRVLEEWMRISKSYAKRNQRVNRATGLTTQSKTQGHMAPPTSCWFFPN